jgi:4-hydroxyacetophenone monooxygenase
LLSLLEFQAMSGLFDPDQRINPRAQNYFKNEHGRSAGNLPFDIRRMWRWLRNPADAGAASERQAAGETATDCAVVPQFGPDLVVQ